MLAGVLKKRYSKTIFFFGRKRYGEPTTKYGKNRGTIGNHRVHRGILCVPTEVIMHL